MPSKNKYNEKRDHDLGIPLQDDYFYVIVYQQVTQGKEKWDAISSPIFVISGDPVADIVTVTKAEYSASRSELKVEATSTAGGSVTLTVTDYGDMTYKASKDLYKYSDKSAIDPGETVTVTSTGGGEGTLTVKHKK